MIGEPSGHADVKSTNLARDTLLDIDFGRDLFRLAARPWSSSSVTASFDGTVVRTDRCTFDFGRIAALPLPPNRLASRENG